MCTLSHQETKTHDKHLENMTIYISLLLIYIQMDFPYMLMQLSHMISMKIVSADIDLDVHCLQKYPV